MNKARRKDIQRAIDLLSEAMVIIETAYDEEQEAYENMPEGLQETDRGWTMYDNIDSLGEARDDLDDIAEKLAEVIS